MCKPFFTTKSRVTLLSRFVIDLGYQVMYKLFHIFARFQEKELKNFIKLAGMNNDFQKQVCTYFIVIYFECHVLL